MPAAEDVRELRALQAKAHGRHGRLTDAEAQRLRELDGAAAAPSPAASAPEPVLVADLRPPLADHAADARTTSGIASEDAARPASARGVLSRFGLPVGIVVVCVALGVLLGWAMSGDGRAATVQLSAEQQEWQSQLVASGTFDQGSVRAVTTERDVVVWYATKDEGSIVCMVLGDGASTVPSCTSREQALAGGLRSSIVVADGEDDVEYEVGAQLYLTRDGHPAVVSYGYIASSQTSNMFASREQAAVAASLTDAGFDGRSVAVVGYDDGVPLWVGLDKETQRRCLVYDGSQPEPEMDCQDPWFMTGDDESLVLERVGDDGTMTQYEYTSAYAQEYPTITREGAGR